MLTPVLLAAIVLLVIGSFLKLDGAFGAVSEKYTTSPFATGFLEGYLTMDTIAALAFGIIVVGAVQQKKALERKQIVRETVKAGVIAGVGLSFVYVKGARGVYVGAVFAAGLVGIIDGLKTFGIESEVVMSLVQTLPLYAQGLGWLLPAVVGGLVGWIVDKFLPSKGLNPASE